jgi:acetyltransferase-like isoleucine patch superfamily enzyme
MHGKAFVVVAPSNAGSSLTVPTGATCTIRHGVRIGNDVFVGRGPR